LPSSEVVKWVISTKLRAKLIHQNTDRAETIRTLQKLLEVSGTTYQKIRVYLALIAARLDYSQNLISMPQDSWVACRQEYDELISILLENRGYVIQEVMPADYNDNDMLEREPANSNDRVALPGSLIGVFENIDNEVS
jgi:translation initiation factor 3 subunit C